MNRSTCATRSGAARTSVGHRQARKATDDAMDVEPAGALRPEALNGYSSFGTVGQLRPMLQRVEATRDCP